MKNTIFIFLISGFLFASCGNNQQRTTTIQADTAHTEIPVSLLMPDFNKENNFYEKFQGTLAGKQITCYIQRINGMFADCNYYMNEDGKTISLFQSLDSARKNATLLFEDLDDSVGISNDPHWEFHFSQDSLVGTWYNANRSDNFPIALKAVQGDKSYAFAMMVYKDSTTIIKGSTKPPYMYYNIAYLQPKASKDSTFISDAIKYVLKLKFYDGNDKETTLSFNTALPLNQGMKDYAQQFYNWAYDLFNKDSSSMSDAINNDKKYAVTDNMGIVYDDDNYINFSHYVEVSMGVSYGTTTYRYTCVDVTNKKILELKDILNIDSSTLGHILKNQYRTQYHTKPNNALTDKLFSNHLNSNNNFYFTSRGIMFVYNSVEIAARAAGFVKIFLPYKNINKWIKPDFKKRMIL